MKEKKEFSPEEKNLMLVCLGYFESALHRALEMVSDGKVDELTYANNALFYSAVLNKAHEDFKDATGTEIEHERFANIIVDAHEYVKGYDEKKLQSLRSFIAPPTPTASPAEPKKPNEKLPDKP